MENRELQSLVERYENLTSDLIIDFNKFNLYEIVHHSNGIEGSSLSLDETFLLLDENLTPENKLLEHSLMAVDHFSALNYVLSLAESNTLLTLNHIQEISARILKSTGCEIYSVAGELESSKGEFRINKAIVGVVDYQNVTEKILVLLEYINKNIDDVSSYNEIHYLAFQAHYQLVSIQPFADGNGALSRLLMNYIQHYHKQSLSFVFQEDKNEYIKSLIETRKTNDPKIFSNFMFKQVKKNLKYQINKLESKPNSIKEIKGIRFLF